MIPKLLDPKFFERLLAFKELKKSIDPSDLGMVDDAIHPFHENVNNMGLTKVPNHEGPAGEQLKQFHQDITGHIQHPDKLPKQSSAMGASAKALFQPKNTTGSSAPKLPKIMVKSPSERANPGRFGAFQQSPITGWSEITYRDILHASGNGHLAQKTGMFAIPDKEGQQKPYLITQFTPNSKTLAHHLRDSKTQGTNPVGTGSEFFFHPHAAGDFEEQIRDAAKLGLTNFLANEPDSGLINTMVTMPTKENGLTRPTLLGIDKDRAFQYSQSPNQRGWADPQAKTFFRSSEDSIGNYFSYDPHEHFGPSSSELFVHPEDINRTLEGIKQARRRRPPPILPPPEARGTRGAFDTTAVVSADQMQAHANAAMSMDFDETPNAPAPLNTFEEIKQKRNEHAPNMMSVLSLLSHAHQKPINKDQLLGTVKEEAQKIVANKSKILQAFNANLRHISDPDLKDRIRRNFLDRLDHLESFATGHKDILSKVKMTQPTRYEDDSDVKEAIGRGDIGTIMDQMTARKEFQDQPTLTPEEKQAIIQHPNHAIRRFLFGLLSDEDKMNYWQNDEKDPESLKFKAHTMNDEGHELMSKILNYRRVSQQRHPLESILQEIKAAGHELHPALSRF